MSVRASEDDDDKKIRKASSDEEEEIRLNAKISVRRKYGELVRERKNEFG